MISAAAPRPLDPAIRGCLERRGSASFSELTVARARTAYKRAIAAQGVIEEVAWTADATVVTGGRRVPVRLYGPQSARSPGGVVVYLHGGGWALGDLDTADGAARLLANATGFVVASVHYRLAPESPYPAALEDAAAVMRWVRSTRSPSSAVGVCGDSAGANLAAGVSVRALAGRAPAADFLALLYPPLAPPGSVGDSYATCAEACGLTAADMRWFWSLYLGDASRGTALPDAHPFFAEGLERLPRTYVAVAGWDPLRDEGLEFARALQRLGVPCTLELFEDCAHGLLQMAGITPRARDLLTSLARFVHAPPAITTDEGARAT